MFTFTIGGWGRFNRMVKRLLGYWDSPHADMSEAADDLSELFEANFRSGGPPGSTWEQLSQATRGQRAAGMGYYAAETSDPGRILWWTGSLLATLQGGMRPPAKGRRKAIRRIQKGCLELWLGTRDPRAAIHHKGARFTRPAIKAKKGKALKIIAKDGSIIFRRSAKAARVRIPPRPLYTDDQVDEVMRKLKGRMTRKTVGIWSRG